MRAGENEFTNETPHTPDTARAIRTLYATPDGALWIGYEGLGLGRFKDGEFSRIGGEEGLPDDYISQIIADDDGWLWFGSDHGIFKIRQSELEQVMEGQSDRVRPINYGQNEGARPAWRRISVSCRARCAAATVNYGFRCARRWR